MKWQSLSVLSCILYGVAGILLSKASSSGRGYGFFMAYCSSIFILGFLVWFAFDKGSGLSLKTSLYAIMAGSSSGAATILSAYAFQKWPDKLPWIVLIGSFYPIVVLVYSMLTGTRPTKYQWIGIALAMLAFIFINMPEKESGIKKPSVADDLRENKMPPTDRQPTEFM